MLFDSHTHLDDESFAGDRTAVIARAAAAGVHDLITVGTTAASSARCLALAAEYSALSVANSRIRVHAAVGIQPNYVGDAEFGDWDRILKLAGQPGVVAIGETGLDRHWDYSPFDLQEDFFDRHIRLAQQLGLPCIIHMRSCEEDVLSMLREARRRGPIVGVMHSFTGSWAAADECIEMGLAISFAGMITYKKSDALRACLARVPETSILVETDSPYLTPEPVRKIRRNEPAHLGHTVMRLAEVRGVDWQTLAQRTTHNAQQLFLK
ncbi:MAG: TatD family hydrolase [Pirellulales bacterium]|nr:TatD family hydrolase [Pirellulales bacterium]